MTILRKRQLIDSVFVIGSMGVLPFLSQISHAKMPIIYFAKGETTHQLTGELTPKQNEKRYRFVAMKGQYTTLTLYPRKGFSEFANVGEITSPSGKMQGDKGTIVYQQCLPETGTYQLRVARNLMATHGGTAGYIAKLTILPVKQSAKYCH